MVFMDQILSARQLLEIMLISVILYRAILWLSSDSTKRVLFYFYGYCLLGLFSFVFDCLVLQQFLLYAFPLFSSWLIIVHSQSLQKKFLPLKKIQKTVAANTHWVDELIQTCLHCRAQGYEAQFIIQCNHDLSDYIFIAQELDVAIKPYLLQLIIPQQLKKYIMLNDQGILLGLDALWRENPQASIEQLGMYVASMDTIVLHSTTSAFAIISQGSKFDHLTAPQTIQILKQLTQDQPLSKGEKNYDAHFIPHHQRLADKQSHS
jgi:hypothetical protein